MTFFVRNPDNGDIRAVLGVIFFNDRTVKQIEWRMERSLND